MRVAVYHNLPSGGAKRTLREQVAGLAARGHVVDAFLPATAEEHVFPLVEVAASVRTFPHAPPPGRERLLAGRVSPVDAVRWAAFLRSMRRLERRIAEEIDAGGYDVALVHPSQFTQAPWTLAALRVPTVYYCHEPLRAAWEPGIASAPVRLALRASLARVDRRGAQAARAIATNSRFTAAAVRRLYGRAATVVYPGVDVERFSPGTAGAGDYLLSVGALHPLKGMDFLVRALARLPAGERPPLRIVSDRVREADRGLIERLAQGLGVRVQLATRVSEAELLQAYRGARLVLCAALREPFGLVALEAMACGRPVLAVREGGFAESIVDGETGFLEERDEQRFADRVRALLLDLPGSEAAGARAAAAVRERWSWARSIDAVERLLEKTAGRTVLRGAHPGPEEVRERVVWS